MTTSGPCPIFEGLIPVLRRPFPLVGADGPLFASIDAEISSKHGPFDIAMPPIWRGGTLSFITHFPPNLTYKPLTLPSEAAHPYSRFRPHLMLRRLQAAMSRRSTRSSSLSGPNARWVNLEGARARRLWAIGGWKVGWALSTSARLLSCTLAKRLYLVPGGRRAAKAVRTYKVWARCRDI